jgi:hypothetical protein
MKKIQSRGQQIGRFFVETKLQSATGRRTGAPVNLEHAISVENITTLPSDIQVTSTIPAHAANVSFAANSAPDAWTAHFDRVVRDVPTKTIDLVKAVTTPCDVSILTEDIKSKRSDEAGWKDLKADPILQVYGKV